MTTREHPGLAAPDHTVLRHLPGWSLELCSLRHFVPGYDRAVPPGQKLLLLLSGHHSTAPDKLATDPRIPLEID